MAMITFGGIVYIGSNTGNSLTEMGSNGTIINTVATTVVAGSRRSSASGSYRRRRKNRR